MGHEMAQCRQNAVKVLADQKGNKMTIVVHSGFKLSALCHIRRTLNSEEMETERWSRLEMAGQRFDKTRPGHGTCLPDICQGFSPAFELVQNIFPLLRKEETRQEWIKGRGGASGRSA